VTAEPAVGPDEVCLGVAITVPPPHREQLGATRAALGDPRAGEIPPHITLVPPTVVAADDVAAIRQELAAIAATWAPFRLHLRGTGSFRPVSPVVFVQVVDGIAACERLEAACRRGRLEQTLRFNYHPHVTIAHGLPDDALDRAFAALAAFEASFEVEAIDLYRRADDGVWQVYAALPLAG
jgi:2'-5' RNA ligase